MNSGNKYHRNIKSLGGVMTIIDVYCVLRAFEIKEPGLQHAIKKLLYAGIRGRGSILQDLKEAIDAIQAEIKDIETNPKKVEKEGYN